MKYVLLLLMGVGLAACDDDGTNGDTVVYEARGSKQCESGGMSPEQSADKLTRAGIEVMQSACGVLTGVKFATMCGAPDGKILLHQIRSLNLKDAEVLGFSPAVTLHDPASGRDFERVNCETGEIIPADK